ncbi:hypothetical protein SFA32_14630 [Buttiauxella sp. HR94]|nr:hypothetical protein SFA32_14630 [Buttiauxella sp. HR94]
MKRKNHLNISHIIGFFVGVVITIIFNWIVFKDPKRITAPGVTSLVAMCTFALALYSATQLKLWLNSKINDKAFKQTEKVLEYIEGSNEAVDPIYQQYKILKKTINMYGVVKFDSDSSALLILNSQKLMTYCDNLTMSILMLKYWNVKLKEDSGKISDYIGYLRDINKEMLKLQYTNDPDEFKNNISLIGKKFNASFQSLESLLKSSYDQLFDHSPKANPKSKSHTTN